MLEKLEDLPGPIAGLKAVGKVSREDYRDVAEPILDQARRDGRRLRVLYQFGPEFQGFTPGGAWEDAKVGLSALRLLDGCAVVSDVPWIRESARIFGFVLPCPVKVFRNEEKAKAVEWLSVLPQNTAFSPRLLPESGVIVVEVGRAITAEDFDALALLADPWIEAHGDLKGLVIHARQFPGWENFGSMIRHARFVRDHHKKIGRIALAAESKVAGVTPLIAEHFVKADVRAFGYDELDAAIAWAKGPNPASPSGP